MSQENLSTVDQHHEEMALQSRQTGIKVAIWAAFALNALLTAAYGFIAGRSQMLAGGWDSATASTVGIVAAVLTAVFMDVPIAFLWLPALKAKGSGVIQYLIAWVGALGSFGLSISASLFTAYLFLAWISNIAISPIVAQGIPIMWLTVGTIALQIILAFAYRMNDPQEARDRAVAKAISKLEDEKTRTLQTAIDGAAAVYKQQVDPFVAGLKEKWGIEHINDSLAKWNYGEAPQLPALAGDDKKAHALKTTIDEMVVKGVADVAIVDYLHQHYPEVQRGFIQWLIEQARYKLSEAPEVSPPPQPTVMVGAQHPNGSGR